MASQYCPLSLVCQTTSRWRRDMDQLLLWMYIMCQLSQISSYPISHLTDVEFSPKVNHGLPDLNLNQGKKKSITKFNQNIKNFKKQTRIRRKDHRKIPHFKEAPESVAGTAENVRKSSSKRSKSEPRKPSDRSLFGDAAQSRRTVPILTQGETTSNEKRAWETTLPKPSVPWTNNYQPTTTYMLFDMGERNRRASKLAMARRNEHKNDGIFLKARPQKRWKRFMYDDEYDWEYEYEGYDDYEKTDIERFLDDWHQQGIKTVGFLCVASCIFFTCCCVCKTAVRSACNSCAANCQSCGDRIRCRDPTYRKFCKAAGPLGLKMSYSDYKKLKKNYTEFAHQKYGQEAPKI